MKINSFLIKRSCSAFCIVFSCTLLKPIKLSLFSHFAGLALLPYAQGLSMAFLAIFLIIQSRYVSSPKILLRFALACSALALLIFTAVIPTLLTCSNHNIRFIAGFITFITIDIISITSLHLFWSTCHNTHSSQNSQAWYPVFIWVGQLAAVEAPIFSWFLLKAQSQDATSISLIFLLASLTLVLALLGTSFFPPQQLSRTISSSQQKNLVLPLILNNQYILHVAFLGMIYETLRINLEYTFLISLQTMSLGEKSSLLYLYQACIQGMGFIISSLTVYFGTLFTSIRYRLLLTPLLSLIGITICIFEQSTLILATSLIIIQGFYNGLHYPTNEILYVQTPTVVHQTLRPWIATFGKYCAQGFGYGLSLASTSVSHSIALGIPLCLAGLWGHSAFSASHYFDAHIKAKST